MSRRPDGGALRHRHEPETKQSESRARPGEDPLQRDDRNFVELLQGVRVAVTGVQVLFAFLLTVPFAPGFARAGRLDHQLYYLALVTAAIASVLFIAPFAQHRILFRLGLKHELVRQANLYGILGAASLAVSMVSATLMVVHHIFGGVLPVLTAVVLAVLAGWLWFLEPALRRRSR
jgi:Family of unknown function (DUF6328)